MYKNLEVEPTVRVQSGLPSTSIVLVMNIICIYLKKISSFAAWVYDTWKNYSLSLYVGSIVIFLSCVIMLYPWYNVRVQRLKQEHLNEGKMDKMEKQIEENQKEPLSKLKKQLFISLESLHSLM